MSHHSEAQNPYLVPASIVAAGLMIAAALFTNGGQANAAAPAAPAAPVRAAGAGCGV